MVSVLRLILGSLLWWILIPTDFSAEVVADFGTEIGTYFDASTDAGDDDGAEICG